MNLYEIEQNENLKSDRAKCEAAKDWQTREIEKLTAVIKDLTDKLQAVTAERDEYKSICEKQLESGWELVSPDEAIQIIRSTNSIVLSIDYDGKVYFNDMLDNARHIPISEFTNDKIFIHKLEED